MSDCTQNTFDAAQLASGAAKQYAELAGDAALKEGTAVRVVSGVLVGKAFVFSVIVDMTLNDEPVDQAILSQIAGAAAGAAVVAVITMTAGATVPLAVVAGAGVVAAYLGDKLVDAVYPALKNGNGQYPPLPSGAYDTRRCHPPIDPTKPNEFFGSKSYRPPPTDPFILDLDGDGVETINLTSGILFDHNADGVKTGTGWVKGDDALLVRDLNDNGTIDSGRELFGDQTLLTNGQLAANGFAALRDLDANADGMIDASDAAFAQLKVWRDLNQDGISQADELQTLAEAGIASIGLTSTPKNQWNSANTIAAVGTYTKTDGSTGTTGDVNLAINTAVTEFTDEIEVPETLLDLPEMSGSGQVRNLQQAAALSPALTDLIRQYAVATTREAQLALMDQMLLAWADTSGMAKSLRAIRGQATY